jgi:hypothetical protein
MAAGAIAHGGEEHLARVGFGTTLDKLRQASFQRGAGDENAVPARRADESDVGAESHDRPDITAARMRLSQSNDVAEPKDHDRGGHQFFQVS